jgi:hypothetical protein
MARRVKLNVTFSVAVREGHRETGERGILYIAMAIVDIL